MSGSRILRYVLVLTVWAVAGCSVNKTDDATALKSKELVFSGEPESVEGKSDAYVSMARAVKYNVDVASHNLAKKVSNQNPNLRPEDIIKNVLNSNVNESNQLYNLSRVLEFAVIYAMTNLAENPNYVENNFYNKSAQHLALAAIRSHQDTWWAERNMRAIDRIIREQQKIVKNLAGKEDRQGGLSNDEVHYKKNLEVALLKLNELQNALLFNRLEYSQLTKTPAKDMNLEGRKFYQLEDFDSKYTLEIFQEAAVRNRNELAIAKEKVKNYDYAEIRAKAVRDYPLVERLDINGLNVENDVYYKALQERVLKIANNLVDAVIKYRAAKKNSEQKSTLRRQAFDELAAAIMAQVDINYQLVKRADVDYLNMQKEIDEQKQKLKQLSKSYKMTVDQELELLNMQISLLENERKAAQVLAERAVALRGLYFNAGFSPFSRTGLKAPISDSVLTLQNGFNTDVVEMLAAASKPVKKNADPLVNDWAKDPNWLENLLQKPGAAATTTPKANAGQAEQDFEQAFGREQYGAEAAKFRTMQLGAYGQKENAMADWEKLSAQFPDLKNFKPGMERSKTDGKILYRLVVHDSKGSLQSICNQMLNSGAECLLK